MLSFLLLLLQTEHFFGGEPDPTAQLVSKVIRVATGLVWYGGLNGFCASLLWMCCLVVTQRAWRRWGIIASVFLFFHGAAQFFGYALHVYCHEDAALKALMGIFRALAAVGGIIFFSIRPLCAPVVECVRAWAVGLAAGSLRRLAEQQAAPGGKGGSE